MRVAVLKCRSLPSFVTWDISDVEALFAGDGLLFAEFAARGNEAEPVVWSDPIDWNRFDVALIRSSLSMRGNGRPRDRRPVRTG